MFDNYRALGSTDHKVSLNPTALQMGSQFILKPSTTEQ